MREHNTKSAHTRRGSVQRIVLTCVATELFVLLVAIVHWWSVWITTYRLTMVSKGRFYRAAAMPPDKLADFCRKEGVRSVIDFRTQREKADQERDALDQVGVRHFHLSSNQVPKDNVVEEFLKIIDDASNYPILVHCTHGVGRTGVFTAIFRMEREGWSNAQARTEANVFAGFGSFRAGTGKGDYLIKYVPRHRRKGP